MATDSNAEKRKALDNAIHQITREFGAGSIMRLGDMGNKLDIDVIPTGSLALDIAVGVGGYPRGRVIEIYGRNLPVRPHWPCMQLLKPRN